jgi:hypothetical protein
VRHGVEATADGGARTRRVGVGVGEDSRRELRVFASRCAHLHHGERQPSAQRDHVVVDDRVGACSPDAKHGIEVEVVLSTVPGKHAHTMSEDSEVIAPGRPIGKGAAGRRGKGGSLPTMSGQGNPQSGAACTEPAARPTHGRTSRAADEGLCLFAFRASCASRRAGARHGLAHARPGERGARDQQVLLSLRAHGAGSREKWMGSRSKAAAMLATLSLLGTAHLHGARQTSHPRTCPHPLPPDQADRVDQAGRARACAGGDQRWLRLILVADAAHASLER